MAIFYIKNLKMNKVNISGNIYLSIPDYAEYCDVTVATVYNWIKDGKVETRKLLNTTFIKL